IEHWNCTQWTIVPSYVSAPGSYLQDVAAITSDDAWAVGAYTTTTSVGQALTMHWNGHQWSQVPNPAPNDSELDGIATLATNDVWAVGFQYSGGLHQMLIEHWDGVEWVIVPGPNVGTTTRLHSVSVASANDVWAVGEYPGTNYKTLIVHW